MKTLPWFGIFVTLLVIVVVGGIGYIIWNTSNTFERHCHEQGGRVVTVHDGDICVDENMRVIIV